MNEHTTFAQETEFPCRLTVTGDRASVHVDLLGVHEEKVSLDLDGTTLVISAADHGHRIRTSLSLPWEARLGPKKFERGALEITLEREARPYRKASARPR